MTWSSRIPLVCVRAGATGTRINGAGNLEEVAANTGRIDFNPANLAQVRGLLVERLATNLLLRTEEFDNTGAWGTLAGGTLTANAETSPRGTATAEKIVETNGSTTVREVTQNVTKAAASRAFIASFYGKNVSGSRRFRFAIGDSTLTNGVRGSFTASTGAVATAAAAFGTGFTALGSGSVAHNNGWNRLWIAGTTDSATTLRFSIRMADTSDAENYSGDGTSAVALFGAMLEVAADTDRIDLTSYVQSAGAQGVRALDNLYALMPTLEDFDECTLYVEYSVPMVTQVAARLAAYLGDDAVQNDVLGGYMTGATPTTLADVVTAGGVQQYVDVAPISLSAGTTIKHAVRVKANDFRGCWNGTLNDADTSGSFPAGMTALRIGSIAGGQPINGHVRRVMMHPKGLVDADLQALPIA